MSSKPSRKPSPEEIRRAQRANRAQREGRQTIATNIATQLTRRRQPRGLVGEFAAELATVLGGARGFQGAQVQPLVSGEGFIPGRQDKPQMVFNNAARGRARAGRKTLIPAQASRLFGRGQVPQVVSSAIDPLSRVGSRAAGRGRSGRPDEATGRSLGGAFPVGSSTVLGSA